jgi:hypothetical protein
MKNLRFRFAEPSAMHPSSAMRPVRHLGTEKSDAKVRAFLPSHIKAVDGTTGRQGPKLRRYHRPRVGSVSGIGGSNHDLESAAVPGPRSCHRTARRGRAAETLAWAVQHPDAAQVRTASAAINPARGAAASCRHRQARSRGAGTLTRILGSQQSGIAIGFPARSDPRRRAGTLASVVSSRSGIATGLPPCSGPRLISRIVVYAARRLDFARAPALKSGL